jgi:O-antigen/teichoic acid export membrane protein
MLLDTALNMAGMLVYVAFSVGVLKVRVRWRGFDRRLLREIFSFSIFVFLNMVMSEVYWNLDKTIMMRVALPMVLITSTSGQIAQYFMDFSNVFSGLFLPRAVQLVTRGADREALTDLMIRVGRLQLMVIGLVVVGFGLAGRQFITLWVGGVMGEGAGLCYTITLMLLLSLIIPLFQSSALSVLQALNKHAFRAVVLFFISVLNAVISVFLAKAYGPLGAALGTAFSLILGNVLVSNWYYHYRIGLNIPRFFREGLAGILPALLLSAGLGCVTLCMPQTTWMWLLARIVVIVAVYAAVMIPIGMNAQERALLGETLTSALRRRHR